MQKGIHPRQSIHASIREACALEGISSQMLQTVIVKPAKEGQQTGDERPQYRDKDKGRVQNATLESLFRQPGVLLGVPADLYTHVGIPESIALQLDIIVLCRRRTNRFNGDIHMALAVRLSAEGTVDVLLPTDEHWIPYATSGPAVGRLFSQARSDPWFKGKRGNNQVKLSGMQLAQFAARVITQKIRRPTIIVIEADGWRNERGEDGKVWPQLKNEYLHAQRDVLDFSHLSGHISYSREHPGLTNVLGIIRLRTGKETPQYITNRTAWRDHGMARDFTSLSGFYDISVPDLPHYFSIGRLPDTQRKVQDTPATRNLYKLDRAISPSGPRFDAYGADTAFKHQQMVEMVPFFIRPDFVGLEGRIMLCRTLHYLRTSPAWTMCNITLPYPMYLGEQLIEDYLCILGVED